MNINFIAFNFETHLILLILYPVPFLYGAVIQGA